MFQGVVLSFSFILVSTLYKSQLFLFIILNWKWYNSYTNSSYINYPPLQTPYRLHKVHVFTPQQLVRRGFKNHINFRWVHKAQISFFFNWVNGRGLIYNVKFNTTVSNPLIYKLKVVIYTGLLGLVDTT